MQKKYNLEFKIEAVKLILENGYSLQEACQNLDVPYKTLSKWKNEVFFQKKKFHDFILRK